MVLNYIPLLFGVMFFIVHFLSEKIHVKHKEKIISFSIGISLSYIFLYLFPEIVTAGRFNETVVFSFVLAGIVLIRLVEIHIWKHKSQTVLRRELREVHSFVFFIYHFIIGMVLFELLTFNFVGGILFFIPVLLHTGVSSLSMQEIHGSIRTINSYKLLLASSTLLGVLLMYLIKPSYATIDGLFGLVVGALLYIVMRDAMPKARKAKPFEFLLGIIVYSFIIFSIALII